MQTPDAKDISKSAESWLTAERLTDLGCIQRQRYERVSIHTQEQRWCRYNLLREFPTFWRKVCHVFFSSASSFLRMRLIVKISESQCCWEVGVWLRWVFLWARGTSAKWTEAPSVKAGQTDSLGTVCMKHLIGGWTRTSVHRAGRRKRKRFRAGSIEGCVPSC